MTVPRIEIDDRDVVSALNRLIAVGESPAPALNAVGRVLKSKIQMGFQTSTDPLGRTWAPLKSRRGQPLRDKGHLMGSIDYQVEGNSVVVGTNKLYAPVHQFGAKIEAKAGKVLRFFVEGRPVFVKRVTIPARPFLPQDRLPDAWGDDSLDAIGEVVRGAWEGHGGAAR
jgi:phage virion morphogenesis protein